MSTPGRQDTSAPLRVLLVDDNVDAADLLGMVLDGSGCATRVAYDARSAYAALQASAFDAVVLDLALPDGNGHDIARWIRGRPRPHPILVAATGYGRHSDRTDGVLAGFDVFLVKPVDPDRLMRAISATDPLDVASIEDRIQALALRRLLAEWKVAHDDGRLPSLPHLLDATADLRSNRAVGAVASRSPFALRISECGADLVARLGSHLDGRTVSAGDGADDAFLTAYRTAVVMGAPFYQRATWRFGDEPGAMERLVVPATAGVDPAEATHAVALVCFSP